MVKSGEKCGKSWKKLEKLGKSGEKWGKVVKVGKRAFFLNFGQNGRRRPFWMSENNFRSTVLAISDRYATAGGHFGLDDNVSYRTRPRYLDE